MRQTMKNQVFRGISKENYDERVIQHFYSERIPLNVPYLVDNIWEWLRPDNMPKRRRSVYASPKKRVGFKRRNRNKLCVFC